MGSAQALVLTLSPRDEHNPALLAILADDEAGRPDEPAQPGPDPGDERPVSPGPDPGPGDSELLTCLALQVLRTGRPVRWAAEGGVMRSAVAPARSIVEWAPVQPAACDCGHCPWSVLAVVHSGGGATSRLPADDAIIASVDIYPGVAPAAERQP